MRRWTNHLIALTHGEFFIQSYEWEYDYETGEVCLSDVDEPMATAGQRFATAEEALRVASAVGIHVRLYNRLP